MHMTDALISPAVGITMWTATAGAIAWCSSKVTRQLDDRAAPLMGVLGAFLFTAQMVNFAIPATGSSGHLGGGLLLTVLLGPPAAFLTIASVLVVQALFFADGGLLALGCNIFNMGFIPAFIVYPLIYKRILGAHPGRLRMTLAIMVSAIVALQLGSFSVVLETLCSGISSLPLPTFLLLMQPIHLAIGIVEGLVTVAIISFVYKARPEIIHGVLETRPPGCHPLRNVLICFLAVTVFTGGIVSWFASKNPDGLEWAVARLTGKQELTAPEKGVHGVLAALQDTTALLPDYALRKPAKPDAGPDGGMKDAGSRLGTSLSGLIGGMLTLGLVSFGGFFMTRRSPRGLSTVAGEPDGNH